MIYDSAIQQAQHLIPCGTESWKHICLIFGGKEHLIEHLELEPTKLVVSKFHPLYVVQFL